VLRQGIKNLSRLQQSSAQSRVEQGHQLPAIEIPHPALEGVELIRGVEGADHGASRSAAYDLGLDASLGEGTDHTDMRPATSRPTPQRKSNGPVEIDLHATSKLNLEDGGGRVSRPIAVRSFWL